MIFDIFRVYGVNCVVLNFSSGEFRAGEVLVNYMELQERLKQCFFIGKFRNSRIPELFVRQTQNS